MSILTNVERKSARGRWFLAAVFAAVLAGGATMVVPFLLMLSGSLRSSMDISRLDMVPGFLRDDADLVRKFLETKYNFSPQLMNRYRRGRDYSFEQAAVPAETNPRLVADFAAFVTAPEMPHHWQVLGGTRLWNLMRSDVLAALQKRVRGHYGGDRTAFSRDVGAALTSWDRLELLTPDWTNPRYGYTPSPLYDHAFALMRERPPAERAPVNLSSAFLHDVIYPAYGASGVEAYNRAHIRPLPSFRAFHLPRRPPGPNQPRLRAEWLRFAREACHPSFVRAEVPAAAYHAYLRRRFHDLSALRRHWPDAAAAAFEALALPDDRQWLFPAQAGIWRDFLATVDADRLYLVGPEFAWRDRLRALHGDVRAANAAYGTAWRDWSQCSMPLAELEARYVREHAGALRRRFATKNFRIVLRHVFVSGRPFYNTLVYVALALFFALTVQPLAAYALSRYRPRGMWKLIFLFMATMAFPPMVSTLPLFLGIKKLHLLNTFAALVLPVAVNGYLIFLLKGFFDSIPKHLYEAAELDGATEWQMFRHITMALSKPILAVVALNAFRLAWMSFMYPLIVCPDEKMHVLAVWLHQFQATAPTAAIFASILVASIPTLLVFLLTQGTIMKGIAIPAEK